MAELGLVDGTALEARMSEIFSGIQAGEWGHIWPVLSVEAWLRGRVGHNAEGIDGI
jgi:hypothetical protein